MSDTGKKRFYQLFNLKSGYPARDNLFYECSKCGDILPSLPKHSLFCSCRNISIDIDYGRISIKEHNQVKLFSEE